MKLLWWTFWLEIALWRCRRHTKRQENVHIDLVTWRVQRDIALEHIQRATPSAQEKDTDA